MVPSPITPIVFYHAYEPGLTKAFLMRLARSGMDPELHVLRNGDEQETLAALWRRCQETLSPDVPLLYAHTKGAVSQSRWPFVGHWREMMEYFCVDGWREAVSLLTSGVDAAGANLSYEPWRHFSGNFWWARAEYVRTLQDPGKYCHRRLFAERWIGSGAPQAVFQTLHNSNVNHYQKPYPPEVYQC
jgi:hypothetical protein